MPVFGKNNGSHGFLTVPVFRRNLHYISNYEISSTHGRHGFSTVPVFGKNNGRHGFLTVPVFRRNLHYISNCEISSTHGRHGFSTVPVFPKITVGTVS